MLKAIVIIRTSTVRQEIESQTNEIVAYAKTFGYEESEIAVIGQAGASAIKVDLAYQKNLNLVYKVIEDNPIERVFAWQLDRIARKPVPFYQFKDFLVERGINLIIKNPSLFLLNDDGSINSGMEVAISLFLTLAEQEMRTKKERFMRAKKYISAKGKFIGARYMMYGYTTDENGYIIIDKDEAAVIRLIYQLYLTKKYSAKDIAKELNERGYRFNARNFGEGNVLNILKNTAYLGYLERNKLVTKYPIIISKEEYEAAEEIRNTRNSNIIKSTKHVSLALKVLKCWECGANYMYVIAGGAKRRHDIKYVCYNRNKKHRLNAEDVCTTSVAVQAYVIDEILSDLSYKLRWEDNEELTKTRIEELNKDKDILNQKIDNVTYLLEHIQDKSAKIVDAYADGYITEEQFKDRISRVKAEEESHKINLKQYETELSEIERILGSSKDNMLYNQIKDSFGQTDDWYIKKTIDKYIKVAYAKAIQCNGTNLTIIMAVDFNNNIYNYIFHQKHGQREGLYTFDGSKLVNYEHINLVELKMSTAIENINKEAIPELKEKIAELNKQLITKL